MIGKHELPLNRTEVRLETAHAAARRQRKEQEDAIREKTERLRALRLAKEAEERLKAREPT